MIDILSLIAWAALLLYAVSKIILSVKEKRGLRDFEKSLIRKYSADEADYRNCDWCGNKNPNSSHVCSVCGR